VAIRKVLFCPHCCNRAPQLLIHTQRYMERSWSVSSGKEEDMTPWSTFVAVCETCGHVLLYDNPGDQFEDKEFHNGSLDFPKSGHLHSSVPEVISKAYEEAYRIRSVAPNAFAVQIRRALEAVCADRGETKGNLATKLKNLSNKGEIPPVLSEASDILRLLGNIGAHGLSESVHPLQAYALDDFFRVIIEYLYIAPSKIEDFRARMKKYKESSVDENT
jgi:hypothetical protein